MPIYVAFERIRAARLRRDAYAHYTHFIYTIVRRAARRRTAAAKTDAEPHDTAACSHLSARSRRDYEPPSTPARHCLLQPRLIYRLIDAAELAAAISYITPRQRLRLPHDADCFRYFALITASRTRRGPAVFAIYEKTL